jgi:hypothetical protein
MERVSHGEVSDGELERYQDGEVSDGQVSRLERYRMRRYRWGGIDGEV